MLHFPSPAQAAVSANGRQVPLRSDSLKQPPDASSALSTLADELKDLRRVKDYGQEDDLKYALQKAIEKVEQLSVYLVHSQRSEAETETALKLARSNLQLALANNEMLEEALKRDSFSGGKDLGWRRWSEHPDARRGRFAKEVSLERRSNEFQSPSTSQLGIAGAAGPLPSSPLSAALTPTSDASSSTPTSPAILPSASSPQQQHIPPASAPPTTQPPTSSSQETRFFRFRFGSGASSPNASIPTGRQNPSSRPQSPQPQIRNIALAEPSHLTSTSLPSLVNNHKEDELLAELEAERLKLRSLASEKSKLEAELEGLSQALFEEANKMVAQERMKSAEMQEELRQTQREKDALKSAMRVVEQENDILKKAKLPGMNVSSSTGPPVILHPDSISPQESSSPRHSHLPDKETVSDPPTRSTDEKSTSETTIAASPTVSSPPRTSLPEHLRQLLPRGWTPPETLSKSPVPDFLPEESPWGR